MIRTIAVTLDADDAREAGHALTALSVAESRNPAFAAICDRVGAQLIASAKVDQVTAETLTDEQIRAEMARLWKLERIWSSAEHSLYADCEIAMSQSRHVAVRTAARARIAAALNARKATP